jgi:hypothetical protein
MMPNLVLDMTSLLAPFCAGCLGFALVGLGALWAVANEDRRRKRAFPSIQMGGVRTPQPAGQLPGHERSAA